MEAFKVYAHLLSGAVVNRNGVEITQLVIPVILGVFRLIQNQGYVVLANEHCMMKQQWLQWTYTTIPNNKHDFLLLVSSSSPSGCFFLKSCSCSLECYSLCGKSGFK